MRKNKNFSSKLSNLNFLKQPLILTESFVEDINSIYGDFTSNDNEYPAMGITIANSPVFVECAKFEESSITRAYATDKVNKNTSGNKKIWNEKLVEFDGKCRLSTVHVHPMNLNQLSSIDISNFDSLRTSHDEPTTYETNMPYPVILINLLNSGKLEILGFWIMDGKSFPTKTKIVSDNSAVVAEALKNAPQLPYFSEAYKAVQKINKMVSKDWVIELGYNQRSNTNAIKASNGKEQLIIKFNQSLFGIEIDNLHKYVDWTRLLNDKVSLKKNNLKKKLTSKSNKISKKYK